MIFGVLSFLTHVTLLSKCTSRKHFVMLASKLCSLEILILSIKLQNENETTGKNILLYHHKYITNLIVNTENSSSDYHSFHQTWREALIQAKQPFVFDRLLHAVEQPIVPLCDPKLAPSLLKALDLESLLGEI